MSLAYDSDVDPHTCRDPECRECGPAADEAADERDERARAAESAALAWDEAEREEWDDPDGDDGCPGDDDTREAKWERVTETWPDEHDPNDDLPDVCADCMAEHDAMVADAEVVS